MLETLHTLVGVYQNNPIYREALIRARQRVAAGRPLAAALEETGLFASMLTEHGPHRRGVGPARAGDGAGRALLQGEDGVG